MKKGFTLAEIMIVLSVIAIITAVLLPAARHAAPNEDLMKFKKGHLTLINVIQELVNSNNYYADGMLDTKPDGQWVDSATYFCNTFADVVGNLKSLDCKANKADPGSGEHINAQWLYTGTTHSSIYAMQHPDQVCKTRAPIEGNEIVLSNNISYYMVQAGNYFGGLPNNYGGPLTHHRDYTLEEYNGFPFYAFYKIFCMDIDGTPENATETDCVNECPFGYGIRVDGKILFGKRASDWFKKTLYEKD